MKMVKRVQPPTGLSRLLFRAPLAMYKANLGWLFGNRILLLHHIGRVTGKNREVILEVVDHDPQTGAYTVASGWGSSAAWYRNVVAKPEVTIEVGRRTVAVTAVPLSQAEGADIFARYAMRHRFLARYLLPRLMGFSVDGSLEDFRAAGEQIPFIRFVPRAPG
ncbi:nitroreductase family deazaflavin-dependent oxidoreductase [Mycolicibacterium smegmatis]|uniref:nitroreductase family deazaflavin-dependent oxidoreductase n=1 Tax=Mycolicibacterium smegmatis TaxID=1772 RepID=UPI0013032E04|nr:nitroreductase family deazaflavin-dependent oxidoreductase [Mycolicibacterium smegmatis]